MSDIEFPTSSRNLEVTWVLFAAANLYVMWVWPHWATVPFHYIWISVILLYGVRLWDWRKTAVVLGMIVVATGAVLIRDTVEFHENADEITEVPLMTAVFLAMAWHARRHAEAVREVQRLAHRERSFVRFASHELRTPITVARGHAELAILRQTDAQATAELEIVLDELDRLTTLSARLLLLAAAEDSDLLIRRPVDVARFVVDAMQRWAPTADRDWRLKVSEGVIVMVDVRRLEAALDALIENAVAFTPDGGLIELTASALGNHAVISVTDSGVGIASEWIERVFEPFARVGFGRDQRTGGTGLGLSIVKAIVEAHQGTVEVASTVGVGTTVTIALPVRQVTRLRPVASAS